MTATQPVRTMNDTSRKTPGRPVTAVLLELAYRMHTTKVVGRREAPAPSKAPARAI